MRESTEQIPGFGAVRCLWTESEAERVKGLLGRDDLPEGTVMGFRHCGAIHTIGMRFPLDVVFLDRHGGVVRVVRDVRPGRPVVWGGFRARTIFEARAGWLKA